MTPAKKAFVWVFLFFLALGVLVGLLKIVSPDSASMTFNDADLTGLPALVFSTAFAAIVGLIFALIIAGIVKLVTRSPAKG